MPDYEQRMQIWHLIKGGQAVDLFETRVMRHDGQSTETAISARRISYMNEDAIVM